MLHFSEPSLRCCLTPIPSPLLFLSSFSIFRCQNFAERWDSCRLSHSPFHLILLPPSFLCSHPYPPPALSSMLRAHSALFLPFYLADCNQHPPPHPLTASPCRVLSPRDEKPSIKSTEVICIALKHLHDFRARIIFARRSHPKYVRRIMIIKHLKHWERDVRLHSGRSRSIINQLYN